MTMKILTFNEAAEGFDGYIIDHNPKTEIHANPDGTVDVAFHLGSPLTVCEDSNPFLVRFTREELLAILNETAQET
jgi:hypothetical protein